MNFILPLKILFYAILVSIDIFALNTSISFIREPNTYLNVASIAIIVQTIIVNILLINFFKKTIKTITNENN